MKEYLQMSEMQAGGRKERSAKDNLIIVNTIIENQRAPKLNKYMFFADAVKCFEKLWLNDLNTLKILYEVNKKTKENNQNNSRINRKYIGQRSGRTRPGIWTDHVLCRNIYQTLPPFLTDNIKMKQQLK